MPGMHDPADERAIKAVILDALKPTGERMVRWTPIRDRLIAEHRFGFWDMLRALHRLHEDGLVCLFQFRGTPYVRLGDDEDAEEAAHAKAQGRVRQVRIA